MSAKNVRRVAMTGLSVAAVLATAACGGGSSSESGSDSSAAALNWDQKGPITFVQGKDNVPGKTNTLQHLAFD